MELASTGVKIDSKIIVSITRSKSVKLIVIVCHVSQHQESFYQMLVLENGFVSPQHEDNSVAFLVDLLD